MPDNRTDRTLVSRSGNWAQIRTAFRWHIPARLNIADLCSTYWARTDPQRLALTHLDGQGGGTRWTFGMLDRLSSKLANALAAHGLKRGDRIAVLLQQSPEVLLTHLAAWKLGAVSLPLFTLFGEEALRFRLADSGAKIVATDAANLEKLMALRPELPDLQKVYCTDSSPPGVQGFWDAIKYADANCVPVDTGPDDPALLIYTSGTTGPPKGVLHGHRVLLGHLPAIELHHEFFPQKHDCGWTPADWAWIGGLMDMAIPCLYFGVPQVSRRMRKFDPEEAFHLISKYGLGNLFLPPTALRMMRSAKVPSGLRVRTISSGGESLGGDLLQWAREQLGASLNEIYGQTECNLVISSCSALFEPRPGAMGKAVPGHKVAIIGQSGHPVAPGTIGEIAVKSPDPVMFLGYWNKPDATRDKFMKGWLKTGDLGVVDEQGYFRFVSRDDDVITSAGYRIGPSEIENCLCGHDSVSMAAVIGVPDPLRSEAVQAHVVLRGGVQWTAALEQELIDRVRRRVSPHVAPRRILSVTRLPMTATGKILRRKLREKYGSQ